MIDGSVAPVLIITYNRIEHLKKTINSLKNNILAGQTDLYIASDFQRSDSDACGVAEVRDYLKYIDGFNSVSILERDENVGIERNYLYAAKLIFENHDRIIFMEDDIVTAPGFLKYMNQALEKYGANKSVFSIAGYCPPIQIPSSYGFDVFFLGRMSAWGCGITKDRFESVRKITPAEFEHFAANKKLSHSFVKGGGKDLLALLKNVAYGVYEAWDVRCMYTQFLNDQYTIYPIKSLVQNIGLDGTGVHCGVTNRMDVILSDKLAFNLPDGVFVDKRIIKANYRFRSPSFLRRIIRRLVRSAGFKQR